MDTNFTNPYRVMNTSCAKRHLLEIKQVFDSLNIKFWLWRGTLLGAIRDKKFVPYEHDMDLAVLAKDWNSHLRKKLEGKGFCCTKKIYLNQKVSEFCLIKYQVKTDICLQYYYPPDDIYAQLNMIKGLDRLLTPARFFRGDCFVKFLDQKFRVPDSAKELLKWTYGENWTTPSRFARHQPRRFWKKNWKPISWDKYLKWFSEHPQKEWPK